MTLFSVDSFTHKHTLTYRHINIYIMTINILKELDMHSFCIILEMNNQRLKEKKACQYVITLKNKMKTVNKWNGKVANESGIYKTKWQPVVFFWIFFSTPTL